MAAGPIAKSHRLRDADGVAVCSGNHGGRTAHGGETLCQLAVSSATIAEAEYPPRLRVPVHTHAHAHIGFLIAGACRETVGRRPYDYETSSLVIKRAGE
jgi:quercetin dioxygenase-like cupin family protein